MNRLRSALQPVRLALITALLLGVGSLSATLSNPLALLGSLIWFLAAAGLWRGVVWCGFGPALWCSAQALLLLVLPTTIGDSGAGELGNLIGTCFSALGAWIFYRAGRSLVPAAGSQWPFAAPWLGLTLLTLLLVFLRPYVIPMGDTLLIGDHIFVPHFDATTPSRGDIIVFRYPVDLEQTFVKRVVGIPGDRVRLQDKRLFVNDAEVDEPYVVHKTSYVDPYRDNFPATGEPHPQAHPRVLSLLRDHVSGDEVVVPSRVGRWRDGETEPT